MRYALFSALAVSAMLCLSACGGGGGGGSQRDQMMTMPDPPDDTMTGGGMTTEEQNFQALLDQIAADATERVGSDMQFSVQINNQFETIAIQRTCEGPTCTVSGVGGIPVTITPENIETRSAEIEAEVQGVQGTVTHDVTTGEHNGVDHATTVVTVTAPDLWDGDGILTSLDGWLQYSAFEATVTRFTGGDLAGTSTYWADAYGTAATTNPPATLGNAVWDGAMVGIAAQAGQEYRGDTTLTLDATNMDLDVTLSNIWSLDQQDQWANLNWTNVPIDNGQFNASGVPNRLEGHFFGPAHEEAAGIFEAGELIGAFGATR